MKAHLMHRDRDFDPQADRPSNEDDLVQDLGLEALYATMGRGDKFLDGVARAALVSWLPVEEDIEYRQQVLRDCLTHPEVVRALYDLAVEALDRERKVYLGMFSRYPASILSRSVEVVQLLLDVLRRLRAIADERASQFASDGFRRFFAMLADQLSDDYFDEVERHLKLLKFRNGVLISAGLGRGNKGTGYVLRSIPAQRHWYSDLFEHKTGMSFTIADRDEAGQQALSALRDQGINLIADALARSADHIVSFFSMLRTELGFYVGCLNAYERLCAIGAPVCEPTVSREPSTLYCAGLYDVGLALRTGSAVVANDIDARGRGLIVVTGANQGGKSTFLRSVGLAMLMMQCGMFVPATTFVADAASGVFTHYKREEDAAMDSGKLDEEMSRMSDIAEHIRPRALLLCNESFASTNEREGSEIARQIIHALVRSRVKVVFVTHLYTLASGLYRESPAPALFLRAERQTSGQRSFRLSVGEPLPTSFGPDLYSRIFGVPLDTEARQIVESHSARATSPDVVPDAIPTPDRSPATR